MSRRAGLVKADWYDVRRAQSNKPATYSCPFCPRKLPAFSEHVLIRPLGHGEGRRHAHLACAARAREDGRLPSREDWLKTQRGSRGRGWLSRLLRRTAR
ncbi:MAG TPA: hypothetical protein VNT55_21235 [Baekduia sp.]|nr:hypothetical protein [Baekduia sp.]